MFAFLELFFCSNNCGSSLFYGKSKFVDDGVVNNSGKSFLFNSHTRFCHWQADIGSGSRFLRIFRLSVGPLLTLHSPDGPDFFRLQLLLRIFLISFKASDFSSSQALCFQTPKSSVQIHFNLCLMQTSFQHTFELGREFCPDNCI